MKRVLENEVLVPPRRSPQTPFCYGDAMAKRVAAIGCGGEESSSAANGLLLSASGSWKASKGVEVFERRRAIFPVASSASQSGGGKVAA